MILIKQTSISDMIEQPGTSVHKPTDTDIMMQSNKN